MALPRNLLLPAILTAFIAVVIYIAPTGLPTLQQSCICVISLAVGIYIITKIFCPYIWADLSLLPLMMDVKKTVAAYGKEQLTAVTLLERTAASHPTRIFLIYKDEKYTYRYMNEQANRVAHMVKTWNVPLGQNVSVMMINEPALLWAFFGLAKLGIPFALLNTNVRKDSLAHCINVTGSKVVIVSQRLRHTLDEVNPAKILDVVVRDLESIHKYSSEPVGLEARSHVKMSDVLCYVMTSGTTGLQKAVRIQHVRCHSIYCLAKVFGLQKDDVLYVCLPLYHGTALGTGLFPALTAGATVVLKEKFSASEFWKDCREHDVTVIVYVGEMLRYLINHPENQDDGNHCVRIAYGNGLRADAWPEFRERFKIPRIMEFFGASEGPSIVFNFNNKVGAVGKNSPFMQRIDPFPKHLVKFDLETTQPIRDENGRCIDVKLGETGLYIAALLPYTNPKQIYEGLEEISTKKIVRNAFKDGDVYFNYGDLLYQDGDYNLFFADRLGDTFRWKSENVSTLEVSNLLTKLDFINDANVYGVRVKGAEGRACMACLELTDGQKSLTQDNNQEIYKLCEESLPSYSRPVFLRVPKTFEVTETFKHKKVAFQDEGYDIHKISDPVYFIDTAGKTYVPITEVVYEKLESGTVRF